jgi:hypothetical protein
MLLQYLKCNWIYPNKLEPSKGKGKNYSNRLVALQDLPLIRDTRVAEAFLCNLPAEKRELAEGIRRTVIQADKKIEEAIKWGNLTFVKNGKKIAFVYTYDKVRYINFGFFKATSLKDPKGLFQGTGKGMRHVKIYSKKDLDKEQFTAWVKEAVKLDEVDR